MMQKIGESCLRGMVNDRLRNRLRIPARPGPVTDSKTEDSSRDRRDVFAEQGPEEKGVREHSYRATGRKTDEIR